MNKNSPIANLLIAVAVVFVAMAAPAVAQTRTVGLMLNDTTQSFNGYTLFAPIGNTTTYLVDNAGDRVNSWTSMYTAGLSAYLLHTGQLLRAGRVTDSTRFLNTGGAGGIVQLFDWDSTLAWQYTYASDAHLSHHDVRMLPNGNVLMIAWELKTSAEAVAAGRNPALLTQGELWPDHVIEVQPALPSGGSIVWEWHVWDHLIQDFDSTKENYGVVADHPELIDINYIGTIGGSGAGADWTHLNAVDYNEALDQIVLSSREFDEIWTIDHSTTTAEAAGHSGGLRGRGGDLLYRWGNPSVYHRGAAADHHFYGQHNVNWIPAGSPGAGDLMVFNNGLGRPGGFHSSIDQFTPPWDSASGSYLLASDSAFGPPALSWTYESLPPDSFYSPFISGATRMPNGNTLICSGWSGTFFEVTPTGETVWEYINPVINSGPMTQGDTIPGIGFLNGTQNMVFRIYRYAPDFAGLVGRDLTPHGPIELYLGGVASGRPAAAAGRNVLYQNAPNPFAGQTAIKYQLAADGPVRLCVYNLLGQEVRTLVDRYQPAGSHTAVWDGTDNAGAKAGQGIYLYRLTHGASREMRKLILVR